MQPQRRRRHRTASRPRTNRSVAESVQPVVQHKEEGVQRKETPGTAEVKYVSVPESQAGQYRQELIESGAIIDWENPQFDHERNLGMQVWYHPDKQLYIIMTASQATLQEEQSLWEKLKNQGKKLIRAGIKRLKDWLNPTK